MPNQINYSHTLATDPLRTFRFYAEFSETSDGVFNDKIKTGASGGWTGGFTSISGLSINTQNIQYREGGYNTTVHQIPGMTTFPPVTFSRGVLAGNDQAMVWMRGLFAVQAGGGAIATPGKSFRTDVTIYVNDHGNSAGAKTETPKMAIKLHNAWITTLNYTDLDATNGAILFETMTLVYEGLSVFYTNADGTPTAPVTSAMV